MGKLRKFVKSDSNVKFSRLIHFTIMLLLIALWIFLPIGENHITIQQNKLEVENDLSSADISNHSPVVSSGVRTSRAKSDEIHLSSINQTKRNKASKLDTKLLQQPAIALKLAGESDISLDESDFSLPKKGSIAWYKLLLSMTSEQSDSMQRIISSEKTLGNRSLQEIEEAEAALQQINLLKQNIQESIIE